MDRATQPLRHSFHPDQHHPFTTTITHSTHPDNTKEFSLPYYLFNAHGTQVTPSINTQQLESEDDRKRRQARLNKVIAQRDANAPDEPEYTEAQIEEMARVVEEKRARVRGLREYADKGYMVEG
ncbi:hypothetical protein N0V88_000301 [Collariella sp. IMI 366227]|nr:hypothetical protein N0V88_000301 [Collariella sp. IMI 366227]